jgi:uncharacterized protein YciI
MLQRLALALASSALAAACGNAAPTECPEPAPAIPEARTETSGFDGALAQRLGADEYGMRSYVIAFLRAGPERRQDAETAQRLQRAHLDNIQRLAEDGKLVLAGPFMDDGELRGIYVFDVATVEEAQALTASDPAIQAGRLVMELHPWYGSAAVKEINAIHERIAEKNP